MTNDRMITLIKPIDDSFARSQLSFYFTGSTIDAAMSLPQDVRDLVLGALYLSANKNVNHDHFVHLLGCELIDLKLKDSRNTNSQIDTNYLTTLINQESQSFLSGPIQLEFFGTNTSQVPSIEDPALLEMALTEHLPTQLSKEISKDATAALTILASARHLKITSEELYGNFITSLKSYIVLDNSLNLHAKLTLFWTYWFETLQRTTADQNSISITNENKVSTIDVWLDNLPKALIKTSIANINLMLELMLHLSHAYYTNKMLLSERIIKTNNTINELTSIIADVTSNIDVAEELEGIKGLALLSVVANDNITEEILKIIFKEIKEFYNLSFFKLLSIVYGSSVSCLKKLRLQADAERTAGIALLIAEEFKIARNKADKLQIAIALLEGAIHSTNSAEEEVQRYRNAVSYLLSDQPTIQKSEKWVIPKVLTNSITSILFSPTAEEVSEEVCENVQSYC